LRGELRKKSESAADAGHALLAWLSPFLALRPELPPDPDTVRQELGRESVAYEIARSRIEALWTEVKNFPDVMLKRQLWSERLGLVYGTSIDDDALFFQHSYLTIVAKTMATLILGAELPAPADLLSGKVFQDAGISGVVESDFFDWVLAASGSDDLIRRISAQVARFRLGDIKHDVLKGLYESLIDPEQRHFLGEFYTPDWLAQKVCDRVLDRPLEQRTLDPSCGSGTFLFHAVRRFLNAADDAKIGNREALRKCTESIFGIDVHPVAVINARVTYLLAMGEERLRDHPSLSIPVYLGDSLQWDTEEVLTGQTVHIRVPALGAEEEHDLGKVPNLTFPIRLAGDPALFDDVLNEMLRLSEQKAPPSAFENWIEQRAKTDKVLLETHDTLTATYKNLGRLRAEERNHIWGYVARNLSRPVWLATTGQKVDAIIGNPPWLAYRDMSSEMQKRLRAECEERSLWAGGKVATHQDESAYFFARCVELYLKKTGAIAMVLPYATMTRQQYRGLRSGIFASKVTRKREVRVYASVRFNEGWAFDESVFPLFNIPSCVLIATEGEPGPLPMKVTAYSGQLPRRDASALEADAHLTSQQASWPKGNESTVAGYSDRFRQGATVVPRFLFLVIRTAAGRLGSNPDAPVVESRRNNLEKPPWKDLDLLRQPIEKEFLRRLYLAESIAPFLLLEPVEAVIPWDHTKPGLLDSEAAQRGGYRHLGKWMKDAETLWNEHGKNRMSLLERLDYYGNLTAQMPSESIRVIYSKAGVNPAAAVLRDQSAVIDHKLYWSEVAGETEASFLVAALNSEAIRDYVSSRQSRGQWGPRDFDKLLAESIPEFESSNPLHQELATEGSRAEKIAALVELPEDTHFIRARGLIRKALREDGVAQRIEKLVAKLLAKRP